MKVKLEMTLSNGDKDEPSFSEPDCLLFGRFVDAKIFLPNDPYVSRQHFILEISPPNCKITDMGSKNGTFVNNVRYGGRKPPVMGVKVAPAGIMETYLKNGDIAIVGDTRMKVSIDIESGVDNKRRTEHIGNFYPKKESESPVKLLEALLKAAVSDKPLPKAPAIKGYHIKKELGRGGMGKVYLADVKKTGETVAIKTMLPQVAAMKKVYGYFVEKSGSHNS